MRARVAYISSLGTTAILVAAALLMLAVVGALVAFRGWPGSANGAVVQPVPLRPGTDAVRTLLVRPVADTKARVVRVKPFAARAAARARARLSTAGLVKQPKPAAVPGIVMNPVAPATMDPAAPETVSSSTPPAVQPPVAAPQKPPSSGPTTTPVGGGDSPLPYVPLPDPTAAGSPQAPTSDQVATMVGELIATAPPPPTIG